MALTDNPYLPLYVRDWRTSSKLSYCSMESHGLMINIMCLMHRENEYGTILLKQKFKQDPNTLLNFANQLSLILPFNTNRILLSLQELTAEGVLELQGDKLLSIKMIKISELSEKRSRAGSKGGKQTQNSKFAKAKKQANTETDIETKNENEIKEKGGAEEKTIKSKRDIFAGKVETAPGPMVNHFTFKEDIVSWLYNQDYVWTNYDDQKIEELFSMIYQILERHGSVTQKKLFNFFKLLWTAGQKDKFHSQNMTITYTAQYFNKLVAILKKSKDKKSKNEESNDDIYKNLKDQLENEDDEDNE